MKKKFEKPHLLHWTVVLTKIGIFQVNISFDEIEKAKQLEMQA